MQPRPKFNRENPNEWFKQVFEWVEAQNKHKAVTGYHYYPVKNNGQRKHRLYKHWMVVNRITPEPRPEKKGEGWSMPADDGHTRCLILPIFLATNHNIETIPDHWLPFQVFSTVGEAAVLLNRAQQIPAAWLDEYCQKDVIGHVHHVHEVQRKWRKTIFG